MLRNFTNWLRLIRAAFTLHTFSEIELCEYEREIKLMLHRQQVVYGWQAVKWSGYMDNVHRQKKHPRRDVSGLSTALNRLLAKNQVRWNEELGHGWLELVPVVDQPVIRRRRDVPQ